MSIAFHFQKIFIIISSYNIIFKLFFYDIEFDYQNFYLIKLS